jgi:hypothetical protein
VTGRAREPAIGRQALVVEQSLAERALVCRIRIGRRKRDRGRPAEFRFERTKIDRLVRVRRKCRGATRQRAAYESRRDERGEFETPIVSQRALPGMSNSKTALES